MNPIKSKKPLRALTTFNGTRTFSEKVVEVALSIPKGRVTTYGRIARACGAGPMASQSITSILSKAWNNGEHRIPWHRIVYASGKVWLDDSHKKERMALYKKEGIDIDTKTGKIKNFEDILLEFK
ncbi:MGMT family protein [Candidatus Nomurabacteria bacterium]|nr:MGMT family protein [Candidatus Nomurabacteria bacterium]USN94801.1 MAG: MGMT family protein [Candidatus Nomurabacteria bacterium]